MALRDKIISKRSEKLRQISHNVKTNERKCTASGQSNATRPNRSSLSRNEKTVSWYKIAEETRAAATFVGLVMAQEEANVYVVENW